MRGKLRIYLGSAPGVGKTYAMLDEGWRRRERGADVVIGLVVTHDRPRTIAQIRDLEIVPPRRVEYRGPGVGRDRRRRDPRPTAAVVLVDELAHTNVPGSRNEKRWQDIEELLAAGIEVISTVNIQHLESLNDVVNRITGVIAARDRARRGGSARRSDRARRHEPGGVAAPDGARQHLRAGEGRRRARQLLPGRQSRRAARARIVVGRRSGRGLAARATWRSTASRARGRRASGCSSR